VSAAILRGVTPLFATSSHVASWPVTASMANGRRGSFVGQSSRTSREMARQKLTRLDVEVTGFAVPHSPASRSWQCGRITSPKKAIYATTYQKRASG
jgi:hypothetical protein